MSFPFLPGEIPLADKLGEGPNSYVVTLTATTTNPSLGDDGEAVGWWVRLGPNVIMGAANILFSGAGLNVGSGNYRIALPVPADTSVMTTSTSAAGTPGTQIGGGRISDLSVGANHTAVTAMLTSATTLGLWRSGASGSVSHNSPFTWESGDRIAVWFQYVVAWGV